MRLKSGYQRGWGGEEAYREGSVPPWTGRGNAQGSLSDQQRRVASTPRRNALLSQPRRVSSRSFSLSDVMGVYKHDIWIFLCALLFWLPSHAKFACSFSRQAETIRKPLKNKTVKQTHTHTERRPRPRTQAAKPCE